jgi:hypothetical protein
MSIHLGSRAKMLVDNHWKGSKKDFSIAVGLKQATYLFKVFKKEDIGTDVLKRMASVLNIDFISFFTESYPNNTVNNPELEYGKPALPEKEMSELIMLREMTSVLRESNILYKNEIENLKKQLAAKSTKRA